jgi:predicted AAA+ superfamily ATPase
MPPSTLTKRDYVARALRGGYPEAVRRDPGRRRARFFDSYVTDLVTRDVQQISGIQRPAEMRRLLSVVAARMATLAVAESIASDVAMPRQTLSRYLDLLELVFVIKRIPAWSSKSDHARDLDAQADRHGLGSGRSAYRHVGGAC